MGIMGLTLGAEDTDRSLSFQIWATSTMSTFDSLVAPGNHFNKNDEYICITAKV